MRCPRCHHHHEDTPNCYRPANDNFMGVRFVVSDQVPENTIMLISPRHNPITGEFDMEATAKASAMISNLKEG